MTMLKLALALTLLNPGSARAGLPKELPATTRLDALFETYLAKRHDHNSTARETSALCQEMKALESKGINARFDCQKMNDEQMRAAIDHQIQLAGVQPDDGFNHMSPKFAVRAGVVLPILSAASCRNSERALAPPSSPTVNQPSAVGHK